MVGMGGLQLKATGQCIFAIKVSDVLTFNEYWSHPDYFDKRPVRNGSRKMMIGDNVYHRPEDDLPWVQADSHHSRPDGSPDMHNVRRDTSANRVLISKSFLYFGSSAPVVPAALLEQIGYKNGYGHRVFPLEQCACLIDGSRKPSQASLMRCPDVPSNSTAAAPVSR